MDRTSGTTEAKVSPTSTGLTTSDKENSNQKCKTRSSTHWMRQDVQLLFLVVMVKFGDAVEMYLPGVITQVKLLSIG